MYTIPAIMLIVGLLLLSVNIHLFFNDYKYVIERNIQYSYLIPNVIGILLAVFIIIYISSYFFTV